MAEPHPREAGIEAPAFYALTGGGWRDWWTLLHPPYTIWHLSYVVLGAASAPEVDLAHTGAALAAFFLGVGLGAHALDELNGRPLRTKIAGSTLWVLAITSIAGAAVIGAVGVSRVGTSLIPFIVFGSFIVTAYNLEVFGGMFHNDFWFAFAWGAFPAFTGFWINAGRVTTAGVAVAIACYALSAAQRTLSTPVRALRRRTLRVVGLIARTDGTAETIDRASLTHAPEAALRALSIAVPVLAAGMLAMRTL